MALEGRFPVKKSRITPIERSRFFITKGEGDLGETIDFQLICTEAENFRKNKQYAEALPLYKQVWESGWQQGREWTGWGYAFCLRKLGRSAEALEICREVYKLKPEMDHNCSLYAWCIFDTALKIDNSTIKENEQDFFKAANAILKLTPETSTFSPTASTVFKIIDYLIEARVNYPALQILEWLDKLDPEKLSKEYRSGPGKDGKQVEYASDEEKWYSEKAKALDKLEKYQESKLVSLKALETLKIFHYDNEIWFNYRVAVADKHLGLLDEAQALLEKVRQRKKDYFIDLELAEVAYAQSRLNDAIKFACSAALAPGQTDLGFRWKVYFLLAQLFKEKGELALAKEHALLVWKIRTEQEWKVPAEVESLTKDLAVNLSDQRSARKIEKGLQEAWKKARFEDRRKICGQIKTVLNDGKSGFIIGEDGKEYYYHSRDLRGDRDLYDYGIEVVFYCEPAIEKGKKDSAIEIHRVDEQD